MALVVNRAEHVRALRNRRFAVLAQRVVTVVPRGDHAADEEHEAHPGEQEQRRAPARPVHVHAATALRSSRGRRNWPVYAPGTCAPSSGVPTATISPPASPPSGP